jgi:hypothetical protein
MPVLFLRGSMGVAAKNLCFGSCRANPYPALDSFKPCGLSVVDKLENLPELFPACVVHPPHSGAKLVDDHLLEL